MEKRLQLSGLGRCEVAQLKEALGLVAETLFHKALDSNVRLKMKGRWFPFWVAGHC